MRYCAEQGCTNKIGSGRYCADHKRKRAKQVVYSNNRSLYKTRAWRDLAGYVYQRDKGCCRRCGKFVFGKRAHAHHIVPVRINPALKLDPDNIMLLCDTCHPIVEAETMQKYFPKDNKFRWHV